MKKCIYVDGDNKEHEGVFYGIFQYSDIINPQPWIGGHSGGVLSRPYALILTDIGMCKLDPINIKRIY